MDKNSSSYNFNQVILVELKKAFPSIIFDLENNELEAYDLIEQSNIEHFSADELLKIRKNEILNSLSYFENHIDFIKSEINIKVETSIAEESNNFNLNKDGVYYLNLPIIAIKTAENQIDMYEFLKKHKYNVLDKFKKEKLKKALKKLLKEK